MSATVLDGIRQCLVRLKMPCALEKLDEVVRQLEAGHISALEAIDTLLSEELSFRENRRIKMALNTEDCDDKRLYKTNFKNALTEVGKKIEVLLLKSADMVTETLNQIIAGISSCGQRKRPNRSYPRCSKKPIGKWKSCKPAKKLN